jgi:hypothetical protein
MGTIQSFLFSLSVLIPFGLGLVRLSVIRRQYRPFILLLGAAVLSEILSRVCIKLFKTNAVVINLYSLIECLIILYLFYNWRQQKNSRKWILVGGVICVSIWFVENLLFWEIETFSPVFRSVYAFFIVILSINEINYLIIHESRHLLKNARFLICIGFLVYFLYQILLEGALYVTQTEDAKTFSNRIIWLSIYINILVNIIYAIAIWFIPTKISLNFKQKIHVDVGDS